jgi:hypothetical protein
MPNQSTTTKKQKTAHTPRPTKGHDIPGHIVGWIAVVALVFSASTLSLAASAQSTSQSVCSQNSIAGIRCMLTQVNGRLDSLHQKADRIIQLLETPRVPPVGSQGTASEPTQAPAKQVDPTQCKLACEDSFNACAKSAGLDQAKYIICKQNYGTCYNACGQ